MKVFISWSGSRSHSIANALHGWLPTIIQTVHTWISDFDIDKGARWSAKLAAELEQTQVGIICLTPDNLKAPWIIFEAGALSKSQQNTYVCTFLYDLNPTDLEGPLAQFQHTKAHKEDVRKLIHTINKAQGDRAIPERQIDIAFDRGWPELENLLEATPDTQENLKPTRSEREMIEEILELARAQSKFDSSLIWRQNLRPRLLSTLDWLPGDAQILYEHYQQKKNEAEAGYKDYLERLNEDEKYAREVLSFIKQEGEAHKAKKIKNEFVEEKPFNKEKRRDK